VEERGDPFLFVQIRIRILSSTKRKKKLGKKFTNIWISTVFWVLIHLVLSLKTDVNVSTESKRQTNLVLGWLLESQ
jgi:hypothetical protein